MNSKKIKTVLCILTSALVLTAGTVPALADETDQAAIATESVDETSLGIDAEAATDTEQESAVEVQEEYIENNAVTLEAEAQTTTTSTAADTTETETITEVVGAISLQDDQIGIGAEAVNMYVSNDYMIEKGSLKDENSLGNITAGQAVANYALQFVGNPYVWGGTSLTKGADCSGFTMSVYSHFGIKLPHSSAEQRSCGKAVTYANAQPGDIICYSGHVAIYIGNGKIVHAANSKSGIIVSNANYRNILTVRRML